jgi:hypothetical protein
MGDGGRPSGGGLQDQPSNRVAVAWRPTINIVPHPSNTLRMDDSLDSTEIVALRKAIRAFLLAGEGYKELKNILATEDELTPYAQRKQDPNDTWEKVFGGHGQLPAESAHHDHREGVDEQNGGGDLSSGPWPQRGRDRAAPRRHLHPGDRVGHRRAGLHPRPHSAPLFPDHRQLASRIPVQR